MSEPTPRAAAWGAAPARAPRAGRERAVIISVGTELTEGITQDAHVRFLASSLTSLGIPVMRAILMPDDEDQLRAEVGRSSEAALILITGGLGPTSDDLTREAVAAAAGVPLEFHPEVWDALVRRFAGRTVPEANRKQAMAPRGFSLIPNARGTAPGFVGTVGESLVVALPGPPSELRPMFEEKVVALLGERLGLQGSGTLWGTALMIPESALEDALRSCRTEEVGWGTRVEEDRIAFSLRGGTASERESAFAALESLRGRLQIRRGDLRPAQFLAEALRGTGQMLVTAESCTGGLIGKYMTDIPGSSEVYWGGVVVYSNSAKTGLLGLDAAILADHGAVSIEAVAAMAKTALERSTADLSLATSGIAGPGGGTPDKPVGMVWVAVCARSGESTQRMFSLTGTRDMVRRKSAVAAMLLAESVLRGTRFLDTDAKW